MKKIRPFSWVIVIINAFFLYAVFGGMAESAKNCDGLSGDELDLCQGATAVGAGIGIFIILFFWVMIDLILFIIWYVTNKNQRSCPTCGRKVKVGKIKCDKCGYEFAK